MLSWDYFCIFQYPQLFFLCLCSLLFESLYSAGAVQSLLLSGVERVRVGGNFHPENGVFFLITLRLETLSSLYRGRDDKFRSAGVVDKEYWAVVIGMNVLFHNANSTDYLYALQEVDVGLDALRVGYGRISVVGSARSANSPAAAVAASSCAFPTQCS